MVDATPRHVGHVQQAVDAAQIDEGAVVGEVLDHAVDDLPDLERRERLAALPLALLLEQRAPRQHDVAAPLVELDDLEGQPFADQRLEVAHRPQVDLRARQERLHADVDREAALHPRDDRALDGLVRLVGAADLVPDLEAIGLLLGEHDATVCVFDLLDQHVDDVAGLDEDRPVVVHEFPGGTRPSDLKPMSIWTYSSSIAEHRAAYDLAFLDGSFTGAKSSAKLPAGGLRRFADRHAVVRCSLGRALGPAGFPGFRPRREPPGFTAATPTVSSGLGDLRSFSFVAASRCARASAIQRSIASTSPASSARARSPRRSATRASGALERLAVRGEDVPPQLGIAARDPREVAKAGSRDLACARRRSLEGAREGEGQQRGERGSSRPPRRRACAGSRCTTRAPSARQKSATRATARRGVAGDGVTTQDGALEEVGARVARGRARGCPPSGAHRRRRRRGGSRPGSVSRSTDFTLPTSVTSASRRSTGASGAQHLGHRAHRRREHHQVGAGDGAARIVADGDRRGRARSRRAAARSRRPQPITSRASAALPRRPARPNRRAGRARARRAADGLEARRSSRRPLRRRRRSALTRRSFSSGRPTLMRTWSGIPKPAQRPHDHALAQQLLVAPGARRASRKFASLGQTSMPSAPSSRRRYAMPSALLRTVRSR